MHSLSSILLIAVFFAAVALSTPTPTLQKRSFKHVVRRSVDKRSPYTGPDAMLKAYRKYGFALLGRQAGNNTGTQGATAAGTGKVAAIPEPNAAEYLSPVNIGGQTLNLDFDTGSSDL